MKCGAIRNFAKLQGGFYPAENSRKEAGAAPD
jgi:hypothetical protein